MPRQKHDLRVRKRRFAAERIKSLGFKRAQRRKREFPTWAKWCRRRGHRASCSCEYPEV